jgi:peptide deformylase
MTILNILTLPDQRLKTVCLPVEDNIDREFIRDLIETATANDLVGLAANQVGVMQRIFVVDMNAIDHAVEEKNEKNFQVFINPMIIWHSPEREYNFEGCASIPNIIGKVSRFISIRLSWLDIDGQKHEENFVDYIARIIQHENNHLDGLLLTDVTKMTRRIDN